MGVDREGPGGAWLLPSKPDASARGLRDVLTKATGANAAVVFRLGWPDRPPQGHCVISVGAAGVAPFG
ncbi:hypothetical protein ABZX40_07070 [Streptomyces sp. NPDC004610]|uniref:hypothetical protein n=1 Tax=unclassified Streptomyces TaxID=2593676 RepID=UPI0033B35636